MSNSFTGRLALGRVAVRSGFGGDDSKPHVMSEREAPEVGFRLKLISWTTGAASLWTVHK